VSLDSYCSLRRTSATKRELAGGVRWQFGKFPGKALSVRLEARSRTHRSRLGRVSKTAVGALLLMLVVSGLTGWATHSVVRSQERRLLRGRASEAGLVFTSSLESLTTGLASLVAVLRLTGLDPAAFQRVTALATPVSPATAVSCLGRYLTPLYRDMVDSSWF
jgi:hypothetical protein